MTTRDHPFQPGVDVALVARYYYDNSVSYRLAKVAKVYKTGRFVLEGNKRQYKPRPTRDR